MNLFADLMSATVGGVTLHNLLQVVVNRFASKAAQVATDLETGNVPALEHDAHGIVDFAETHAPALTKSVEDEVGKLKADAAAEVAKVRQAAADELRKLAASVESVTGASTPAPTAPAVDGAPSASDG